MIQDIQSLLPQQPAAAAMPPAARGKLIIFVPDTDPILFELMPGITTVGRGMENHLVLGDPYASRKHLIVTCKDGAYFFEDTGSDNGTLYNGSRAGNSVLRTGDVIEIGSVQMRFVQGDVLPQHHARPPAAPPGGRRQQRGHTAQVPTSAPAVQQARPQRVKRSGASKAQVILLASLIAATIGLIIVMVVLYLGRQG